MKNNDDFDLMKEISRGALYRGGDDMRSFLSGYAWGAVFFIGLIVGLSLLGLLLGA